MYIYICILYMYIIYICRIYICRIYIYVDYIYRLYIYMYLIYLYLHIIYVYIWVNYNISLTLIKAIWGWFPLLKWIPGRSQWGRHNLPRYVYIYILLDNWGDLGWTDPPFTGVEWTYYRPEIIKLTLLMLVCLKFFGAIQTWMIIMVSWPWIWRPIPQSIFKQTHTVWFDSQKIPAMFAIKIPQFPQKTN